MFISHKANILQQFQETEWECRRNSKGQSNPEYWAWIETITSGDPPVVTYPSEDFTIVECTDEDVQARLVQLSDYMASSPETGTTYNIKWSDKKTKVTVDDVEIETHFTGDDSAKDARLLADKWAAVRRDRDMRLAETDFWALGDAPSSISNNQQIYRQKLRDVPKDNSDPDNISWPTKP